MEELYLENRMRQILLLLLESREYLTSDELAYRLGSSARTVREDIYRNKKMLGRYGIQIKSKTHKGYYLEMPREHEAELREMLRQTGHPQDKTAQLMRALLLADDYQKLDDIADELWISRSTADRLFKEAKATFDRYHLSLVSKPFYGIRLEGNERDRRLCLVQCCLPSKNSMMDQFWAKIAADADLVYEELKEIVESCIGSEEYQIAEASQRNLIVHLAVAVMRIRTSHLVQDASALPVSESPEGRIAREIAEKIEKRYKVEFPAAEIDYIQIHLKGKRFFMEDGKNHLITGEMEALMMKINHAILEEMGMDFRSDVEHFAALSLHMLPMLTRVRYGLRMENPVLYDIKRKLPLGYECAVIAAGVIGAELGCKVTEEEKGYLAMHYAVAIDHLKKSRNVRVVVVCSSGLGTSRLLKHKVMEQFRLSEKEVLMLSMEQLSQMDLSDVDYIFSMVPITMEVPCQIIYVENPLAALPKQNTQDADKEQKNLAEYLSPERVFLQVKAADRKEMIEQLCSSLKETVPLPEDFLELVWKREQASATEIGGMAAIPHPAKICTKDSCLAIAVLKKPIIWYRKPVKYVFLISYGLGNRQETERLNEALTELAADEAWLKRLGRAECYEDVKALL